MFSELHDAFILHSRPYQDHDLILEAFTKIHGRICIIAKKARSPRSQWRGILRPFVPLLLVWRGKTDLVTLRQAEADGMGYELRHHGLLSGLYLNELLIYLLQRADPHPEIFELYQQAITELSYSSHIEKNLRIFEKKMLSALGFALPLSHVLQTNEKLDGDKHYHFSLDNGAVCIESMGNHKEQCMVFRGKSLLDLHDENLEDDISLKDAKRLMRHIINQLINYKPLKVRELFL